MQIDLITVGELKENYLKEAKKEYVKRLSKFCKLNEIVIKDKSNKLPKSIVLQKEAEKINKKLKNNTYIIVLAINGKQLSSIELSQKIDELKTTGFSHITFIIGGSYGLDESIVDNANYILSFSKLTFPHQLFKILLLEQIYRSYKISNNENYHK